MPENSPPVKESEFREAIRIELHGQNKIFESIPKRKMIKVKAKGPFLLDIQFIETPEPSPNDARNNASADATVKEMSYCGGYSIWWK